MECFINKCLIIKDTSNAQSSRQTLRAQASARSSYPYEQDVPKDDEDAAILFLDTYFIFLCSLFNNPARLLNKKELHTYSSEEL
jgi:hypothetical protein